MDDEECPFCGHHPYEYVDVGVGGRGVPVAITCCELGSVLYDYNNTSKTVEITRETFKSFANAFQAIRLLGMTPQFD
jgi:hypothetical protein